MTERKRFDGVVRGVRPPNSPMSDAGTAWVEIDNVDVVRPQPEAALEELAEAHSWNKARHAIVYADILYSGWRWTIESKPAAHRGT